MLVRLQPVTSPLSVNNRQIATTIMVVVANAGQYKMFTFFSPV
jgi:hypothetical protein